MLRHLFSHLISFFAVTSAPIMSAHAADVVDGQIEIEFWHSMSGAKNQLLQEIVRGFNSSSSAVKRHLKVRAEFIGGYEEGLNKLRTSLLAGPGPHVVQITDIGSKVMIDSDAVIPLQKFIDADLDFPIAQILPAIRGYYQIDGLFYSLPFATSNPILYYNVDHFRSAGITRAPMTFAELEADARKLTNAKNKVIGLTWPLHSWFFEQFVAKQGALLVMPANGRDGRVPTEVNYLSKEAKQFVEIWARMVKDGTFSQLGRGWDPAEANFLAGRVSMLITSTSDIFEIEKQAPFRLGTAAIPGPSTEAPGGGTIVGGNSLWILKNKPERERQAAYEFVKYMASSEVQRKWHTHTGYFPIRNDVIDQLKAEGFYLQHPNALTAIEQMRSSPVNASTKGALIGMFPEAREHIMTAIEEVLSRKSSIEEALKRAKARSDFSLKRYELGNRLR